MNFYLKITRKIVLEVCKNKKKNPVIKIMMCSNLQHSASSASSDLNQYFLAFLIFNVLIELTLFTRLWAFLFHF